MFVDVSDEQKKYTFAILYHFISYGNNIIAFITRLIISTRYMFIYVRSSQPLKTQRIQNSDSDTPTPTFYT